MDWFLYDRSLRHERVKREIFSISTINSTRGVSDSQTFSKFKLKKAYQLLESAGGTKKRSKFR